MQKNKGKKKGNHIRRNRRRGKKNTWSRVIVVTDFEAETARDCWSPIELVVTPLTSSNKTFLTKKRNQNETKGKKSKGNERKE